MAVLETPWFMKTKTSDLRKVNQVFEERLQKQKTVIELKQRKSLMKIEEEIKSLRMDFRRIRTEVDFSTDLDEHGKKVGPEASRSKSTGDLCPMYNGERVIERPMTKSALTRHRKFVQALKLDKKTPTNVPIIEMLKEKYGDGSEVRKLEAQLQQKAGPLIHFKRRKSKVKKKCVELKTGELMKCSETNLEGVKELDEIVESTGRLPSIPGSARERRFSISTPRKRTHEQLPLINGIEEKLTKTETTKCYEI